MIPTSHRKVGTRVRIEWGQHDPSKGTSGQGWPKEWYLRRGRIRKLCKYEKCMVDWEPRTVNGVACTSDGGTWSLIDLSLCPFGVCAQCDKDCPENDYLCEECRSVQG